MVPVDKNEICEVKLLDIDNIDIEEMNYELKVILKNIDIFKKESKVTYCI